MWKLQFLANPSFNFGRGVDILEISRACGDFPFFKAMMSFSRETGSRESLQKIEIREIGGGEGCPFPFPFQLNKVLKAKSVRISDGALMCNVKMGSDDEGNVKHENGSSNSVEMEASSSAGWNSSFKLKPYEFSLI